jgi:hypothetical protein
MHIARAFASDPQRRDGVRPFNIWGLRLFYLLMLVFVVPDAWHGLLTHQGPWDPLRAVTVCVWATYPALAVFGLIHPLRWLPLMFFTIGYKSLWLFFVAWPMWQAGTLAGSPAEEIAYAFGFVPVIAAVVPWGYAYRTFVRLPRRQATRPEQAAIG